MKKPILCILTSLIIGGLMLNSCDISNTASDTPSDSSLPITDISSPEENNSDLFKGRIVYYDCGASVSGSDALYVLTDGDSSTAVTLTPALKTAKGENINLSFSDWYGGSHEEYIDNSAVDFYIDMGFISTVNKLMLHFDDYSGKPIKVFYSTDGYNFSYYLGEFDGYDSSSKVWTANLDGVSAKSVMFVIPAEAKEKIVINTAEAYGVSEHKNILLSKGASYTWEGNENGIYSDNGTKLTDGVLASVKDTSGLVAKTSSEKDELTGKKGSVITLDLGSVKNVSEVDFGAFITSSATGTSADRIDVRYSENGNDWLDFGQSYVRTATSRRGTSRRYLVTRNHTVSARYIKVYTYAEGLFICDEISVYGSETPVAEPDYGYPVRNDYFASNTNAASYCDALLNGSKCPALTDNLISAGTALKSGDNTISVTLKNNATVAGVSLVVYGSISDIKATADGKELQITEKFTTTAAGQNVYYLLTDGKPTAKNIDISFKSSGNATVAEAIVYAAAPHLPYVRGGFFQLPTSGGINESAQNSDYSWYLQLKGMRDMGMEYVVLQYSTHFKAKTTLINGKRITAAGYTYNPTYGSTDVCKAVLDAAEKLGMKVWLGTIHDSDFTNPTQNMKEYEQIVSESRAIIDDIYELYGNHPAFGGYYLSDETCDQWLNIKGGAEAARYVYKGQSDRIRELDSNVKIMIAPAIWRSGDPVKGADNLYRMIAPEKPGARPVVDILAAQDCLGREATLAVTDDAYRSYISYMEEWAKATRRAGAEFWHDAEVFEITSTQKRHDDLLKTLSIEAPVSGSIIVFDIPHYFSIYPMGSFDNEYDYFKRLKMREYAEYYSTVKAKVDNTFNAVYEKVENNDGKTIETDTKEELITPPKSDVRYNPGILVNSAPTADISWTRFATANKASSPEYAMFWDNSALYLLVKTNDQTADFGNGDWWTSKNDLLQLWITGDGSISADAAAAEYGLRYYVNRTGNEKFSAGGEYTGKATLAGIEYSYSDGIYTVTIPWKSLGRTVPEANDGTAVGISVQYIDGSDSSWAAATGNSGRSITAKELYSF